MTLRVPLAFVTAAAVAIAVVWAVGPGNPSASPAQGGLPTFQVLTIVTTTVDNDVPGQGCSLREAIIATNNDASYNGCTDDDFPVDSITFNIGTGVPVINVASNLPAITAPLLINGNSGGATRVELRGPPFSTSTDGLVINADDVVILNLVINGFEEGIRITAGAENTQLKGNYIGTDATGTIALPNVQGISNSGTVTTIGGTNGWVPGGSCTGDCNLISGNSGRGIGASGSMALFGNMIGTNASGTAALPNGEQGILTVGRLDVGGQGLGAPNLISGNTWCAVRSASSNDQAVVQGNYIGTDTTGMSPVPNGCGVDVSGATVVFIGVHPSSPNVGVFADDLAILISDSSNITITSNRIGVAADGETPIGETSDGLGVGIDASTDGLIQSNVIAHRGTGVSIASANGDALRILVRANSIHSNTGKGIVLLDGGPPNQPANLGIQPPVITGHAPVRGTACANCVIDVYSDDKDEGRIYEGNTTADGSGNWTFDDPVSGPFITATANDPQKGTSEFSTPFDLTPPTPTPSLSPTPSPTPTASPTPTPSATPTPTATAAGQQVAWGDNNCSGNSDPIDGLLTLRHDAGLEADTDTCPEMGAEVDVQNASLHPWGDFDCNGLVDPVDALKLLRFDAGLSVDRPEECPDPGEMVTVTNG